MNIELRPNTFGNLKVLEVLTDDNKLGRVVFGLKGQFHIESKGRLKAREFSELSEAIACVIARNANYFSSRIQEILTKSEPETDKSPLKPGLYEVEVYRTACADTTISIDFSGKGDFEEIVTSAAKQTVFKSYDTEYEIISVKPMGHRRFMSRESLCLIDGDWQEVV